MRTIIALCVLALAACGSSGGGDGSTASCTLAAEAGYDCFEASGLDDSDVLAFSQGCVYQGGTAATSGCTSTNRVGRCALSLVYGYTTTASYYAPMTVQEAQASCLQLAGTWTSG